MTSASPAFLFLVYGGGFVLFWGVITTLIVLRVRASRRNELAAPATLGARKWNTFSIVALVLSLYVVLVPLVFGIVALVQISKSGDRGAPLAIAAIALQCLGLLGLGVYLTIGGDPI